MCLVAASPGKGPVVVGGATKAVKGVVYFRTIFSIHCILSYIYIYFGHRVNKYTIMLRCVKPMLIHMHILDSNAIFQTVVMHYLTHPRDSWLDCIVPLARVRASSPPSNGPSSAELARSSLLPTPPATDAPEPAGDDGVLTSSGVYMRISTSVAKCTLRTARALDPSKADGSLSDVLVRRLRSSWPSPSLESCQWCLAGLSVSRYRLPSTFEPATTFEEVVWSPAARGPVTAVSGSCLALNDLGSVSEVEGGSGGKLDVEDMDRVSNTGVVGESR